MKKTKFTQDQLKIFSMLRSVILCMKSHPDNEENSEFSDRVADLKEIVDDRLFLMFKQMNELENMLVKSNEIIKILDSASSDMINEIRRSTKNHDNRTYVFFNEQIESLINKATEK